ncbi:methyl-accepting chemotaxis protein [Cupriavidus plantarum]|uniref:MotA/TolQ/ExbB proton channel family protein n=1 Tax=Cupriavidus plantarum TaxID=942865 RepID=A0A316EZK6_9BURK|nr:methyl-accepting chemotaxis protein [Cupriavidus plantarum]PWK37686.1 hypothetical protein C7419_1011569 [Cupriavidus plantarum]
MLELLNQLGHFLIPQLLPPEPLQIGFFLIIFGLAAYTCRGLSQATPANWERNWRREAGPDAGDLDIEHGSVNDLSAAVATRQEKLADIMPGMLLIVGLLGTFVGLGMALDKASTILSDASGGGNVDAMMGNLMSMMHGLGSKFKTSTWGITAFLILKSYSNHKNYDERRLSWCIARMKSEVDRRKAEALQWRQDANARIVEAIGALVDTTKVIANAQATTQAEQHASMVELLRQANEKQVAQLRDIALQSTQTRDAIESFVEGVSGSTAAVAEAANGMAEAANDTMRATTELQSVIGELRAGMKEVLGDMKHDLGATIKNMGQQFSENMDIVSTQLGNAASDISTSVNKLSANVDATLKGVKDSIESAEATQAKAFASFETTSETLNVHIESMTTLVNKLSGDITGGLRSVATTGQKIGHMSSAIGETLEKIDTAATAMKQVAKALQEDAGQDDLLKSVRSIDRQVSDLIGKAPRAASPKNRPGLDA